MSQGIIHDVCASYCFIVRLEPLTLAMPASSPGVAPGLSLKTLIRGASFKIFRHMISESGDFNSWSDHSRFLRCAARLLCQRRRPSNTVICVRDAKRTHLLPECFFELNRFDDDDYFGAPAENGERPSQKPPLEWHEAKPKTLLEWNGMEWNGMEWNGMA